MSRRSFSVGGLVGFGGKYPSRHAFCDFIKVDFLELDTSHLPTHSQELSLYSLSVANADHQGGSRYRFRHMTL